MGLTLISLPYWFTQAPLPKFAGLILLLCLYIGYQRLRRLRQNELFRIVSENAADMIALVEVSGKRLYNSPAYEKVLGYSAEELAATGSLEQVHPDDRERVIEAAKHLPPTPFTTEEAPSPTSSSSTATSPIASAWKRGWSTKLFTMR